MALTKVIVVILGIFLMGVLFMSEGITGMVSSAEKDGSCERHQGCYLNQAGLLIDHDSLSRFYMGVCLIGLVIGIFALSSLKIIKLRF